MSAIKPSLDVLIIINAKGPLQILELLGGSLYKI